MPHRRLNSFVFRLILLLARVMGQCLFCSLASVGVCRLSSFVTLPAGRRAGGWERGRSGGRHSTAGKSCYVPLKRQLVTSPPTHNVGGRLITVVGVCRRRRLSSSVTLPVGGPAGRRALGRSGGRH